MIFPHTTVGAASRFVDNISDIVPHNNALQDCVGPRFLSGLVKDNLPALTRFFFECCRSPVGWEPYCRSILDYLKKIGALLGNRRLRELLLTLLGKVLSFCNHLARA